MSEEPFSKIDSNTLNLFFFGEENDFKVNISPYRNWKCCSAQLSLNGCDSVVERKGRAASIGYYGAPANLPFETPTDSQVIDVKIQMPVDSNLYVYSSCKSLSLKSSVPYKNVVLVLKNNAFVETYARNQIINAANASHVVCYGRGGNGKLHIINGCGNSQFDVGGAFSEVDASICDSSLTIDGLVQTLKLESAGSSNSKILVEHLKSIFINGRNDGTCFLSACSIEGGRFVLSKRYALDMGGNKIKEMWQLSSGRDYHLTRSPFGKNVRMPSGISRLTAD